MPDLMQSKLGAYLDGELNPRSRAEVEAHLQKCANCREELESLQQLSHLLHGATEPEFTSPQQFKAQVMLQLPARPGDSLTAGQGSRLYWLAPAIGLGVWLFLQATLNLSASIEFLNQFAPFNGMTTWLQNNLLQMSWLSYTRAFLSGLFTPPWPAGLPWLNGLDLAFRNLFILLLIQLGAALFYWAGLLLAARRRGVAGLLSGS